MASLRCSEKPALRHPNNGLMTKDHTSLRIAKVPPPGCPHTGHRLALPSPA
ncbi:hypothetical protein CCACVL1_02380 [Corchorus capsularis]|uniref:Uncharacterized protein n=1 Tax=Corchorus capsularis TaxID=210143 RepID=A0A1R3K8W8_COCAP|nr:hypothetical protein CCACVL1_02380 [Corchorus capsularis]